MVNIADMDPVGIEMQLQLLISSQMCQMYLAYLPI